MTPPPLGRGKDDDDDEQYPHEHTPLNPSIQVQHDGDELMGYTNRDSIRPPKSGDQQPVKPVLIKTQLSFWQDLKDFAPGTIPHSMIVAVAIGTVCGVAAFVYYAGLEWLLDFLWHTLPEKYVIDKWPEHLYVLWIPIIGFSMALCVGLTVRFMGEPGDLPYTIACIHEKAFVAMDHVLPMVCASQFSILAGGSLGPEAPLVAICAALGGFMSRQVFGVTERNLVRKHTLMGMAGALAAFFGCPLGGSLFALEVNSRFGIEYFEHVVEAIFCGEVCLAVFRGLAGLPIQSIWTITDTKLTSATAVEILSGAMIGLIGAGIAWIFAMFHGKIMGLFRSNNLLQDENAIQRALIGAIVVVFLGMCVPHTMFWGEFEFQTISTMGPSSDLPHIWPTTGLFGLEMNSFGSALLVGVAKLVAISFTVSGGYRGGYIFPAFASAAAFGRAIYYIFPFIPVQLCVLCMAAALNVALTRTSLATTLILSYLSGEQCAISAILASSLTSLFVTGYMHFIRTQMVRSDLDSSLYYSDDCPEVDEGHGVDDETAPLTPMPDDARKTDNGDDIINGVGSFEMEEENV